jgi:xylan 1,4-beta-xylosidase
MEIIMYQFSARWVSLVALLFVAAAATNAQTRNISVRLNLNDTAGPLEMDRFALGQGGLSEEPMWADRAAEIRDLHPRLIRLFIQEYFDLLPERGRYHFEKLDESVDLILKTGAKPLMNIDFKPKLLYPAIDHKIVDPTSYEEWEQLIYNLVRHYKDRGAGIRYWEVSNEPDIGEDGGCPYLFTPENYTRYYQHTVAAVLRADPEARVGGPALANSGSSILPALLSFCAAGKAPLHFVSWHIYNSDPMRVRATIDRVKAQIAKYPSLQLETHLNEWNMALRDPPTDPQYQPCYITEVAYQMKAGGLDYSCYYHIRDYHVDRDRFAKFMSPVGAGLMARWWNRSSQWDGLFDFQNRVRPSYYAFKLLSRLTGDRLRLETGDDTVHGFATWDAKLLVYNVLLWNYSTKPAQADLTIEGASSDLTLRQVVLDAAAPSDDENARLKPFPSRELKRGDMRIKVELGSYGINFLALERRK